MERTPPYQDEAKVTSFGHSLTESMQIVLQNLCNCGGHTYQCPRQVSLLAMVLTYRLPSAAIIPSKMGAEASLVVARISPDSGETA